jgi:glycosyltransferase involved in cell wall biosynthesis
VPSTPLISAVIPAHDARRFIDDALESVLAQTYPSVECVVVDDGSTDGTLEHVRAFGRGVRIVGQENAGPGAARNRGARESSGELLAFLDADDRWLPTRLEKQMEALRDAPALCAVVCATEVVTATFEPLGVIRQSPGLTVEDMLTWRSGVASTGSNLLITRECFETVGGFDEESFGSEDWLMSFQLVARAVMTAIDEPLVQYRVHESNLSSSAARLEREMLAAYAKAFAEESCPEVSGLRRKAYGNLHRVLAGSYLAERELGGFARHAVRGVLAHPPTAVDLGRRVLRRARGERAPQDPYGMAREGPQRKRPGP